ncbi:hypothetical protein AB0911_37455 [Streptomyces nigra]|uniref:COG4315 family predicted lipoprotein n=1 Tax=Streptomyces nigra TaxID=1827580 RepID=UPI0034529EAF
MTSQSEQGPTLCPYPDRGRKVNVPLRTPTLLALAMTAVFGTMTSCTEEASSPPSASTAAVVLPNSDIDFDGTFLAGTASENGAQPGTGDFAPAGQANAEAARRWVQISADPNDPQRGPLRDGAGRTLYYTTQDVVSAGSSTCVDVCARRWPPVVIDPQGRVFADGVATDTIGAFRRPDGLTQLTVSGRPVYRFAGDSAPGQTRGHAVDSVWFAATPSGGPAQAAATDRGER